MAGSARSGGKRRNDLQGLRAVAVLLVAASHAGIGVLRGGFVGVDVFFVLSGFFITGLLLSDAARHGRVSFSSFYMRRAKRILPAATLTLVVTMLVSWQFLNFVRAREIVMDSVWASAFAANVRFSRLGTDYFARGQPPSPIQHFWSLSVEEQFYVVWPALLSFVLFGALSARSKRARHRVSRRTLGRLLAVVLVAIGASLVWSIHLTKTRPAAAYFSTFTRVWELALGAALAIAATFLSVRSTGRSSWPGGLAARVVVGWAGLAAIVAAAVSYSSSTPFPGAAALLPTLGAVLVIAAGIGVEDDYSSFGTWRLLSFRPFRYVGDRSYAFYLWHWPVLIITALYVGHSLSVPENLLLLVGAFLLSVVSYRFVENPIHRARWNIGPSVVLWPASFSAVVLLAAVSLSSLDAQSLASESAGAALSPVGLIQPTSAAKTTPGSSGQTATTVDGRALPAVVAAVASARRSARIPVGLNPPVDQLLASNYSDPADCTAHDGQTSSTICSMGNASSRRLIVVFGDSHSEMWMPAIILMARKDGWKIRPLSKSACTPEGWLARNSECRTWYLWAVNQVNALHPDVVLISGCCGGFTGIDAETVKTALFATVAAVKPASKHAVIVGDNVGIDQQPVDCLLGRNASMKSCTTAWPPDHFFLNQDIAAVAKRRGFGFIDTNGWFCFQNECPMVVDHTIVYTDTGHITSEYAQALATPFRTAFQRALAAASSTG